MGPMGFSGQRQSCTSFYGPSRHGPTVIRIGPCESIGMSANFCPLDASPTHPIPTPPVLRLAHIQPARHAVPARELFAVAAPIHRLARLFGRLGECELLGLDPLGLEPRRGEGEHELVRGCALRRDGRLVERETMREEHVVRLGEDVAVELDLAKGIKSFKREVDMIVRELRLGELEGGAELPIGLANPLMSERRESASDPASTLMANLPAHPTRQGP